METMTQDIPRAHWGECLDDLTELYQGWRVRIEALSMDMGDQWLADGPPLLRMRLEVQGPWSGSMVIEAGDALRQLMVHHVLRPTALRVAVTDPGAEGDIQITSEDDTITLITLRRRAELPPGSNPPGGRLGRGGRTEEGAEDLIAERDRRAPQARERDTRGDVPLRTGGHGQGPAAESDAPTRPAWRSAAAGVSGAAGGAGAALGQAIGERREAAPRPAPEVEPRAADRPTSWWPYVLRGAAAVLFGVLAIAMPGMALLTLVLLFGAYALVDGVLSLIAAIGGTRSPRQHPRWALVVMGVVSIAAGLVAMLMPGITALALLFVIAGWAVAMGVMEIIAGARLSGRGVGAWALVASGVLSVVLGVMLALFPGAGALGLVLLIGVYAIIFGVLLIVQGLQLRRRLRAPEDAGRASGRGVGVAFGGRSP